MTGLPIPVWAQVVLLIAIPAALVAAAPRRWLARAMALWLASPLLAYVAVLVWEGFTRPPVDNPLGGALLGLSLISALLLIPWVILCGVGFLIGFGLRRLRPARPEPARTTPAPSAQPAPAPAYRNAEPRTPLDDPKPATAVETSPDGSIRVAFDWVEWRNSQWVRAPRVTDLANDRVVLNLWGSDWDATASFPNDRAVRLHLERCHFGGWFGVEIDLAADTYRIVEGAGQDGPLPAEPLSGIADGLEAAWLRFAETAPPRPMVQPRPFAAWRTALVIAVTAAVLIALATILSLRFAPAPEPKAPLATVPTFRP